MKEIKKVDLKLTLSFLCEEDEWNKMIDEAKNDLEIHLRNFVRVQSLFWLFHNHVFLVSTGKMFSLARTEHYTDLSGVS